MNKRGIKVIRTTECERVVISENSVNSKEKRFNSPLMVYHMKQRLLKINLFDTSMVHPLPILFFGDKISIEPLLNQTGQKSKKKPDSIISLSNMLRFKSKKDTALVIQELRAKLDDLLEYKITHPGCVSWLDEKYNPEVKLMKYLFCSFFLLHLLILYFLFFRAIMELITSEDIGDIDIETDEELSNDSY